MSVATSPKPKPLAQSVERRAYFRVTDAIALRVSALDADKAAEFEQQLKTRMASADGESLNTSAHMIWRNIEENHPDIAAYLLRLERRLDAMQEQMGAIAVDAVERTPTHTVNISGSGLHFEADEAWFIGQLVHVSMRLFPSGQSIDALAKVVRGNKRATPAAQGKFSCALEFVEIPPGELEALLQHIHALQMESLRTRDAELD